MKFKYYDIIEITWLDSYSGNGWKTPEEYKEWADKSEDLFIIKTLGYYVGEDKNFIRVAQGHDSQSRTKGGSGQDDYDSCCAVVKSNIKSIKLIRRDK